MDGLDKSNGRQATVPTRIETFRGRIDPLLIAVVLSTAAVVVALVTVQLGRTGSTWTVVQINLAIAIAALFFGVGKDRARNPPAAGAGILTLFAALGLPAWLWFGTFALFSSDIVYTCARLSSASGYRSTSEQTFVRSYVPPGLFCLPQGQGGPVVLGTELGTVIPVFLSLLVIVGFLVAAIVLAIRSRSLALGIEVKETA